MNMLKRRPVQVGAFLCTTQNHSFNPQSLRDSPGGALGTVFPKPLASLRASRNIHSTPSHFVTAPVGHWGPYSPTPLRRFAPMSLVPGVSGISLYAGMLFVHILYLVFDCITCPWEGFLWWYCRKIYVSYDSYMFLCRLYCLE